MNLLLVAGDPSGDLHASRLIRALKKAGPADLRVAAVGGALMRREADEFIEDLASRGVAGFWEPVAKLPFMAKLALRLDRHLSQKRPDAVVCVDYYGFNRRVLGLARRRGVPAFYFISPQVWASRPWRIRALKRLVRKMLVIFPFEERLYRSAGVPCEFVGHPLLDELPPPLEKSSASAPLRVGLLPGSRRSEVARHLPLLLEALAKLRRHYPEARGEVFAAASLPDSAYPLGAAAGVELVRESDYARRQGLDLALCSSGTATLENALLGIPMVVVYRMSWPTYAVARALIRVDSIAMANILAGRKLAPELIQGDATPARVAEAAVRLLEDPRAYARLRQELASLRQTLGLPGACRRAAETILSESRRP
ncbi:MAG: lipid-A-disaccharide synthase [Elusimicrobia bacterium]|nr:lipid-A-disaccharide synthase [Elusimicrobiota bacterium]MDE2424370.1 lipid-A-disaccharide synthase [Elusimicrobiota bacterium]